MDDALLDAFSLHHSREEVGLELKTVGVVAQLIAEVTIACSRLTGDDGDALTEERKCQLFL